MKGRSFHHSIVVIICFYGQEPWYFSYFIHSCGYNPSIDYLIFSDINFTCEFPLNVRIVRKSIEDIQILASEKIGLEVNISYPYKLCDFKPAYGLIFSDYIKNYDFWGQSDIDLIYGDLRLFLTKDLLDKNDYVSIRHDYTTGCFSIHRNSISVNNIFKKSKDFVEVFTKPIHYCFDECAFAYTKLAEGKSIREIRTRIESFTEVIVKAVERDEIRAHFDFLLIEGSPGKIRFDKGKIFYKRKYEAILYHMCRFKKIYFPNSNKKQIPEKYKISPTKIYI